MRYRIPRLGLILAAILALSLAAAGYLAWQLRRTAPPPMAGFLAAEKGYGVTVDLTRYDDATLAGTLDRLQESGLTWLRQPADWAELEPEPGRFNWQSLDRVMAALEGRPAARLILVLQAAPAWARPDGTPPMTPPTEISDWGRFARALAERYGNRVDFYQIWHEPNLSANWGNAYVDPAAYANLLAEASLNIRAADPKAFILTAALAPTLENGPLNLNELVYLDQLYQARAGRWFDIVAGQAYGFDVGPEAPAGAAALNFRRLELLRGVMLAHGDAATPVWATAFGWNALPAEWAGRPAPWHSDSPSVQARRTTDAITYARRAWPWLGPMLAVRWDAAGLAGDDPARGFALAEAPPVFLALQAVATNPPVATPGRYPAGHPSGRYSLGWRFARTLADPPRQEPRTLAISFEGTRLDLTVNRGLYRGYLWVTVDGEPANALPQDDRHQSYAVLYDPLRASEGVTLARDLPPGLHEARIEAEGGWGQWPIGGWAVYDEGQAASVRWALTAAGLLAAVSGLGLGGWLLRRPPETGRVLWTWGQAGVNLYAGLGERAHLAITFGLAVVFYLAPGVVALAVLPPLAVAVLLRPDLGLALVAFSLSFFQALKVLPGRAVSPVELALLLALAGFAYRGLLRLAAPRPAERALPAAPAAVLSQQIPNFLPKIPNFSHRYPKFWSRWGIWLHPADWAALALVGLGLLATLAAENFGVSMREWRVVVLNSVIFYFLVRLGLDYSLGERAGKEWGWAWRLVDAFVAGAALQALIALYLYFFTGQSITAEGVRRAMGLAYGSPNNLSLFLDRAWPILLAVALFPGFVPAGRRWLYGAALIPVSLALYLTFSKGALLLGLPASLAAMALFYGWQRRERSWRRGLVVLLGGLLLLGLALVPLSQTERFRTLLDFEPGSTGFFRLKLWQASAAMLIDHPLLGVGLDNFLYQYRTRYILPEAWQEPNLSHPHNLVLDFGTRLGLGGIAWLVGMQVIFWRRAVYLYRRRPFPLILGLLGSMVVFLSHGLVDNSYFLVDLAFIFFLTIGIIQRLAEQVE